MVISGCAELAGGMVVVQNADNDVRETRACEYLRQRKDASCGDLI